LFFSISEETIELLTGSDHGISKVKGMATFISHYTTNQRLHRTDSTVQDVYDVKEVAKAAVLFIQIGPRYSPEK